MKLRISKHPCFDEKAHLKFARIHLPVAKFCNIGCKYCIRLLNKTENRPGIASRILSPRQALNKVRRIIKSYPLTVVGIAGPGDPLANDETFQVLELIKKEFPKLMKCLSTNGLLLLDYTDLLKKLNLATLTVTVNAVLPKTATRIYDFVVWGGKKYCGIQGAEILLARQQAGIKEAVKQGIAVKINTVLIPEVNKKEIPAIAKIYGSLGAKMMNIIPLIPIYRMASCKAPDCNELKDIRSKAEKYISQFRLCKQCRADAVGIPGLQRKDFSSPSEYFHF
ncbi:MAG: radical SAM protein [Candidatus Omnitrophota bacterium]|nr:radical SAM protein [Candidatus Omnitrophota bacterium]